MTRIFLVLASLDGLALAGTALLGLLYSPRFGVQDNLFLFHFNLALFTLFLTLGLHCLVFIYFLGTGRWVKEVALAYDIPDAPLPRLTRDLKRRTFPPALFAMLLPTATGAAGMGALMQSWPWWVHAALAVASLLVNGWAFVIEYRNVRTNAGVLHEIMCEVDRIRAERGLPSNAEGLRQEEMR